MAYNYRKNKNQTIEPELNEELAKRFPGYDKDKQTFGNSKKHQRNEPKILQPISDFKVLLYSFLTSTKNYSLYFDNNQKN